MSHTSAQRLAGSSHFERTLAELGVDHLDWAARRVRAVRRDVLDWAATAAAFVVSAGAVSYAWWASGWWAALAGTMFILVAGLTADRLAAR